MSRLTINTIHFRIAAFLCTLACGGAHAAEKIPVPGGGWLTLDKKGLQLQDASGGTVATVALRAKHVDARFAGGKGLAVVLDADTQHALPIRIDVQHGGLTRLAPLPATAFGVESLCMFRDRQGLDHLFIAGKDGQAEQWLMEGEVPRLVRKLSMPLDPGQCRVNDAAHTLYIDEPGVGTWAYEADSEAMPARVLLEARKPRATASADGGADSRARALADAGSGPAALAASISRGVDRSGGRGASHRLAGGLEASEMVVVSPRVQTEPVARLGDVADDPAIWVHPIDPARSRVLGTNKKQGLMVYDMQGRQVQFLASGRLNNVDLRQRVRLDGEEFDLAVASQRDDNTVVLYGIDNGGLVSELTRFGTGFDDVYGICLFKPLAGGLDVVVNDKDGRFRQYRLGRQARQWTSTLTRSFKVASQPEGCVADDSNARLFLGEEKRGVWTMAAGSDQPVAMQLVLGVGKKLRPDVEGMAIYRGARADYLIVSSQGDSSYVVLDTKAPYAVRGRFKVGFNLADGIDGTADTDGLDVTAHDLGGAFAKGMLVIQDGYKRMPDGPQNFKYVSWSDVAAALKLD